MSSNENSKCIFCAIASGHAPSYTIWSSDTHVAFLSIYPNTPGVTVVIPKRHYQSYVFDMDDEPMLELIKASKEVARMIDCRLAGVGRTAMVFEGFGVDHVHAKLFPLHGTADMSKWNPILSTIKTVSAKYEGYISSHDGPRADDADLAAIQRKLSSGRTIT